MRPRQEQVVFFVALALVGLIGYRSMSTSTRGPRRRTREAAERSEFSAPELSRALPAADANVPALRELFAPPRDTQPLPPLDFEAPPRAPLSVLLPPPEPGPQPELFAEFLVGSPPRFAAEELYADFDTEAGDADPSELAGLEFELAEVSAGNGAGDRVEPRSVESAQERVERLDGYRKLYDWIRLNEFSSLFGRIENPARFGLRDRDREGESVLFVQLRPESGAEFFPGQGAIAYERERVKSFGFAETIPNEIEMRRRDLGSEISPANFLDALELADFCIENRLETPRALEIAEELYSRTWDYDPGVFEPSLGLARCFEAGFKFEEAFVRYEQVVKDFPLAAAPLIGLAELEERFLLFDAAERHFLQAQRLDNGFATLRARGQYLLRRGRSAEALEVLADANAAAPSAPEFVQERVDVRVDLGTALVQRGQLKSAASAFQQALRADPSDERAVAGLLSVLWLLEGSDWTEAAATEAEAGDGGDVLDRLSAGVLKLSAQHGIALPASFGLGGELGADNFELTLLRGLFAARFGAFEIARDQFRAASEVDPMRAHMAHRAQAWLAWASGNNEQAMSSIAQAIENNPGDAWALYFRGVLLSERDELDGAGESFQAALDVELDFEDALLAAGDGLFRGGRYADAERYLERCSALAPERVELWTLRGLNFTLLGDLERAEAAFSRCQELEPREPASLAGLAWCVYAAGESEQAQVQLRNMDDTRRGAGDDDAWRAWARGQIERISDHLEKVKWTDSFERREIRNGWVVEQRVGPRVELVDGRVVLDGTFNARGDARIFREYKAGLFVSFEARVRVSGNGTARVGVFLGRERERRGESEVVARAALARHKDGLPQVELRSSGQSEGGVWLDLSGVAFPADEWVVIRIELNHDGNRSPVTLYLDGIPVVERHPLAGIGQSNSILRVGLFAEGDVGRSVRADLDDVNVVFRR